MVTSEAVLLVSPPSPPLLPAPDVENPEFLEEFSAVADEMAEHQDLILAKVDGETDEPLAGQYGIERCSGIAAPACTAPL